jgi:hypothetical protein
VLFASSNNNNNNNNNNNRVITKPTNQSKKAKLKLSRYFHEFEKRI